MDAFNWPKPRKNAALTAANGSIGEMQTAPHNTSVAKQRMNHSTQVHHRARRMSEDIGRIRNIAGCLSIGIRP